MGVWNSHTSVGNILGALIPAAVLGAGWGWCFVVPGLIMAGVAVVIYLALIVCMFSYFQLFVFFSYLSKNKTKRRDIDCCVLNRS